MPPSTVVFKCPHKLPNHRPTRSQGSPAVVQHLGIQWSHQAVHPNPVSSHFLLCGIHLQHSASLVTINCCAIALDFCQGHSKICRQPRPPLPRSSCTSYYSARSPIYAALLTVALVQGLPEIQGSYPIGLVC